MSEDDKKATTAKKPTIKNNITAKIAPAKKKAPTKSVAKKAVAKPKTKAASIKTVAKKTVSKKVVASPVRAQAKNFSAPAAQKSMPVKKISVLKSQPSQVPPSQETSSLANSSQTEFPQEPASNEKTDEKAQHTHDAASDAASESAREGMRFDRDKVMKELKGKDWAAVVLRGVFMLLFGILCQLALYVTFSLAVAQFIIMIVTGKANANITNIIAIAARYMGQTMDYLSFKTEEKPFPFDLDFPSEG